MAVGSLTQTDKTQYTIKKTNLDWLANSSGVLSDGAVTKIHGEILRVTFSPDGGSTQPDDNYDVTLKDTETLDVLAGQGANLSESVVSNICPGVPMKDGTTTSVRPMVVTGALTLAVSGAGSLNAGNIDIYYR